VPANRALGLLVAAGLSSACLLTLAGEGWLLARLARRRSPARPAAARRELEPGAETALVEEGR
jgi:hypothetical protein